MRVFDRFEVQFVAITRADGGVSIMQVDTKAWNEKARLAAEAEIAEYRPFVREATDEYIEALIAKTELPAPAKSWRRIRPEDLPATRENRDAWRDDGAKIAVDPTRIKPPVIDPRDVKIADLEARLAKLKNAKEPAHGAR